MRATARAAALPLVALLACAQPSFVDRIVVVNDTDYHANVDVSDVRRSGWLDVAVVEAHEKTTVEEVSDQGDVWIFRFEYTGEHVEEMTVSRRDLQRTNWTVTVPHRFGERLKAMGVPPPP